MTAFNKEVMMGTTKIRSGKVAHLLLFVLAPIIMMMGITTINAIGKVDMKTFAMVAERPPLQLCIIEDLQKMLLVIIGAFSGSAVGLIFRIEEDAEFAKRNINRRISYMTVSLLTSSCWTPYLLMQISADQPKPLCLATAMGVSFGAWVILEIAYPRLKGYFVYILDKFIPLPKADREKDKPAPPS